MPKDRLPVLINLTKQMRLYVIGVSPDRILLAPALVYAILSPPLTHLPQKFGDPLRVILLLVSVAFTILGMYRAKSHRGHIGKWPTLSVYSSWRP